MFNFLNSKLLPKISCKSPSSDNYEVENLVSDQYSNKLRGFIAYPSIKPPVEIEFEFLCNINIFYIFLNTTVGNQRCSGLEIFAKSANTPYVSISKAIYDAQGVIFCNSRKYSKNSPPPCYKADFSLNFFKGMTFRTFLNTSKLKVVIFRTEKSVPCLASVEIWGVPSKTCSAKTVETVHRLMGKVAGNTVGYGNNISTTTSGNSGDTDVLHISDDFKDDLTYELMTIPYTLPSGKTIDQTTLEKHEASEKSFGRKPCDPFTGIKFNDKLKPILNVGLKSRIDMFLLQNSHRSETFNLKRSLGSDNFVNKKLKPDSIKDDSSLSVQLANSISDNDSDNSDSCDNLDSLIRKAKSDTNFISFSGNDENKSACIFCKMSFQYLYELPCKHRCCRDCVLVVSKESVCKNCGQTFVKSDVKKCNL